MTAAKRTPIVTDVTRIVNDLIDQGHIVHIGKKFPRSPDSTELEIGFMGLNTQEIHTVATYLNKALAKYPNSEPKILDHANETPPSYTGTEHFILDVKNTETLRKLMHSVEANLKKVGERHPKTLVSYLKENYLIDVSFADGMLYDKKEALNSRVSDLAKLIAGYVPGISDPKTTERVINSEIPAINDSLKSIPDETTLVNSALIKNIKKFVEAANNFKQGIGKTRTLTG